MLISGEGFVSDIEFERIRLPATKSPNLGIGETKLSSVTGCPDAKAMAFVTRRIEGTKG